MTNWFVGQKVVCITDDWEHDDDYDRSPLEMANPVKGTVYTIRDIELYFEGPSFRMEEIVNPIFDGFEGVYEGDGFRPVQETDISVFTKMLVPTNETVERIAEKAL